jgi:CSLREA domain-containing protein
MVGRLAIVVGIAFLAGTPLGDVAGGQSMRTFTVDTTADAVDAVPGDGVCRSAAGRCTLRAALNEVSSLPSDGTPITISVPAGTYPLSIDPPGDSTRDEQGGDLDLTAHSVPSPSVTIIGAGAGRTLIHQRRADRVLQVTGDNAVTIMNMTLDGGHGVVQGGGINNGAYRALTLRGVEVLRNTAGTGGGIFSGRPLTVDHSIVADNDAQYGGGILLATGTHTITGSTISGNTAVRSGGGVLAQNVDRLDIGTSLIADNSATTTVRGIPPFGGGILVGNDRGLPVSTTVNITYSTVRGNTAGTGGGLSWEASGTLTLEGTLFSANTAEVGGAIETASGGGERNSVVVVNSTMSGNAAERGGAVLRGTGDTVLRGATIAGNTAPSGSGFWFNGGRLVYATMTGTILANEPAAQNCSINGDLLRATEHITVPGTNIETGSGCGLTGFDRSDTDPRLGPLADNGGPTQTRALLPGSPALDRYTIGDCPALDERGYTRPAGPACDIGAFERNALPTVTLPTLLRPRQDVIGGLVRLIPFPGSIHTTSLRGGDYRPCTGGNQLNEHVGGGYFEPRDGQVATRGLLVFRRSAQRAVRLGNLLVLLDRAHGRVMALLAPGSGPVPLFDVVLIHYGQKAAHGRLRLTKEAARLLNRQLGVSGFHGGQSCGQVDLHLSIGRDPGPPAPVTPPPPPPPPPPKTFSLVVSVEPGGDGSVESDVSGISCPGDCGATYAAGTVVRLTATPAEGQMFDNWAGDCRGDSPTCTLTIDANKSVTAKFKKNKPQCSDGKDNDGDGAIDFPLDPQCKNADDDNEAK